jgi:molecular chaperone DnaJ
MDPYATLDVGRDATQDDIKRAYKRLAMKHHPDKNKGCKDAEEEFKKITTAYDVLSDTDKRSNYDRFGTVDAQQQQTPHHDFFRAADAFEAFFGNHMHHSAKPDAKPDRIAVTLAASEVLRGARKRVEFEVLQRCEPCRGSGAHDPSTVVKCLACGGTGMNIATMGPIVIHQGTCGSCAGRGSVVRGRKCDACKGERTKYGKRSIDVVIPPGIQDGLTRVLEGQGSYDPRADATRDLHLTFSWSPHAPGAPPTSVDRDSGDAVVEVRITLAELLGGFDRELMMFGCEPLRLSCRRYFDPDKETLLVPKRGMPVAAKGGARGELKIKFKVSFEIDDGLMKCVDAIRARLGSLVADDGQETVLV